MASAAGLLLGGAAAWDLVRRDAARRHAAREAAARPVAVEATAAPTIAPVANDAPPASSDRDALWQSPTQGEPFDLRYLPSGSQLLVHWRPAAMFASEEGQRLWQALGPWAEYWQAEIERRSGLALQRIADLRVALGEDPSGALSATLVVESTDALSEADLLTAWGNPAPIDGHANAWRNASQGYFFPVADHPKLLVIAPADRVDELLEQGDRAPVLSREIEQLAAHGARDRWLTVVMSSGFLSRAGAAALVGEAPAAWTDLQSLLGDDAKAAALSCHVDERLFCELRLAGRSATQPRALAAALGTRLDAFADTLSARPKSVDTTPGSRELLDRLPAILQMARAYTRVSVDDDQVVARVYLPTPAAHHLALAAQVLLVDGAERVSSPPAATSLRGLQQTVTLRAPRTTLESALAELSQQIGASIELDGPALQREGITRNQMFAVDVADQPASVALERLLQLANPEGKLVYVVTGSPEEPTVTVTTRAASAAHGAATQEARP